MHLHYYRSFLFAALGLLPFFASSVSAQFLNERTMTLKYLTNGVEVPSLTTNAIVNTAADQVELDNWGGVFRWDVVSVDANQARIVITANSNRSFNSANSNAFQISFLEEPLFRFANLMFGANDIMPSPNESRLKNSSTASTGTILFHVSGLAWPTQNSFVTIVVDLSEIQRSSIDVSQVRVCWNSTSTNSYQVQYKSQLTTNEWVDLGNPVAGNGTMNCVTDAVTDPKRFYQVRKLP